MPRKLSDYRKVLKLLDELHSQYPSFDIMRHITTATCDYGDTWGMKDKELLFALEKYQAALSLDKDNIVSESYVNDIIKDAENLTYGYEEEE